MITLSVSFSDFFINYSIPIAIGVVIVSIVAFGLAFIKSFKDFSKTITLDTIKNKRLGFPPFLDEAPENQNYQDFVIVCKRYLESIIKDRDDLYILFSNKFKSNFRSFDSFLSEFLYWLLYSDEIVIDDVPLNNDQRISIKEFIIRITREEEDKDLFQGVSQDERASLLAISSYARGFNNYGAVKRELNSLSSSMIINQIRIKNEARNNRIAIAISLLSLLATVILSLSTNSMLSKNMEKQKQLFNSVDSISRLYDGKTISTNIVDSVKSIENNNK